MIKTIILDLGGVYFKDGTTWSLIEKIYKFSNAPREKINEIFATYPYKKEGWLYRVGKIDRKAFWQRASKKLGFEKSLVPRLEEIWFSAYQPIAGMKEIAKELRKRFKVIAFSGNIKERVEYLDKKYGLMEDFDDFIFSFDAGFNKMENEFYEYLLGKIKSKPAECVLIDDKKEYLKIASTFGFKTILFKSPEQLKDDLQKFGINI